MLAVEIVLIIIGVIILIGSYFVEERFSDKDIQKIAKMSETQLNIIVEKQVKQARSQVEDSVDEIIEESLEVTKRGLEKETNEKIMAVSEYSDTVLEAMNKTHNEIMFLYSMLNDKQSEITDVVGALQKYSKANAQKQENTNYADTQVEKEQVIPTVQAETQSLKEADIEHEGRQESMFLNKNEQIILLHKEGKSEVDIAKAMDCGLGEVRLVLGLFVEEGNK